MKPPPVSSRIQTDNDRRPGLPATRAGKPLAGSSPVRLMAQKITPHAQLLIPVCN